MTFFTSANKARSRLSEKFQFSQLSLILDDQGVAVSTGSACSSNHANHLASHVLKAIGRNAMEARGGIRISLGRYNTAEELKVFIERLHDCLSQLIAIYH